jgi:tRNA pseudouridine13 synthase
MFEVEDLATEQTRYAAHQISFTAPIYGPKMWAASGAAGELELAILAETGVTLEDFRRVKVEGSRRLGRLLVPDLHTQPLENALSVEFFLPKGAFATTVLREFMKIDLLDASEFVPEVDGEDGS